MESLQLMLCCATHLDNQIYPTEIDNYVTVRL